MPPTRVGIIGVGFIGEEHLKALQGHQAFQVVGITDQSAPLAEARAREYGVALYPSPTELVERARPDYVTICTPHFSHTTLAAEAMRRGVHALVEKPLAVSASAADECLEVMRETGCALGIGFGARLRPDHARMHELVRSGCIGSILRVTMVRTEWFRSMAYYRSSPWRGTWKGEGGGILANQAPHDLDLLVWTAGLPAEVLAEVNTSGHDIEVEDDVCALLKWPGGATGTLHVSTSEAPGRSFYEIAGTKATVRLEEGRLTLTRLSVDSREFSEATDIRMDPPPTCGTVVFEAAPEERPFQRLRFLHENFAAALREGTPLVCPAEDGLREVELANALLISGLTRRWTRVPVARGVFDTALARLMEAGSLRAVKGE